MRDSEQSPSLFLKGGNIVFYFDISKHLYFYKKVCLLTVIPIKHGKFYTTGKWSPSTGWRRFIGEAHPLVKSFYQAEKNLSQWAIQQGLRRAECNTCIHCNHGYCEKYAFDLEQVPLYDKLYFIRSKGCDDFEEWGKEISL